MAVVKQDDRTLPLSVGDLRKQAVTLALERARQRLVEKRSDNSGRSAVFQCLETELEPHFPEGTSVVVDLTTFSYVSAPTRTLALKAFLAKFGNSASG